MQNRIIVLSLVAVFLVPLTVQALEGFPEFPMSFWGAATINGSAAPIGTVIRAYSGNTLVGSVIVDQPGIYGYTEPARKKLIVSETSAAVTFTVQSPSFNNGLETAGDNVIVHPAFESGISVQKDLVFIKNIIVSSGGGGGGGGGGNTTISGGGGNSGAGGVYGLGSLTTPSSIYSTSTVSTGTSTLTIVQNARVLGVATSTFNFSRTLKRGMNGEDVRELQKILIANGFLNIRSATTFFGALTEKAVTAYQRTHNLEPVGYVGPKTRELLNGIKSNKTASEDNRETLIAQLRTQLQSLMAQLEALKKKAQ